MYSARMPSKQTGNVTTGINTPFVEYVKKSSDDLSRSERSGKNIIRRENKERKWLLHCQILNVVAGDVTIPIETYRNAVEEKKSGINSERKENVNFAVRKC